MLSHEEVVLRYFNKLVYKLDHILKDGDSSTYKTVMRAFMRCHGESWTETQEFLKNTTITDQSI